MSQSKLSFKTLCSLEAHKESGTLLVGLMGSHYEAVNGSALFFANRFFYIPMKTRVLGIPDFIKVGFPTSNEELCFNHFEKSATDTENVFVLRPNDGTDFMFPSEDDVKVFLSSHDLYQSRRAMRQALWPQ